MTKIPDIAFHKKDRNEIEFEIFRLSSLFSRRDTLDHMIERDHRIHFYMILLVTEGSGVHRIDFHPYRFEPGSVLLISKDQIQAFDSHFQSEGFAVLFTEQFLIKNVIHSDILFLHRLFNYHLNTPLIHQRDQSGDSLAPIFDAIYNEYHSSEAYAKEAILRSFLKILLVKAERIKKRSLVLKGGKPGWIDLFTRYKNLVAEHHTESRNARDYAARMGVSYKHLTTVCKYATGHTPKNFIDDYMILEIKRQLAISDWSIKELTYHFNFDESTNFIKYFKKQTGLTPTQFRKTN